MALEDVYNTKVYTLRDGNVQGLKSDGEFNFAGTSVLAQDLRRILVSEMGDTVTIMPAAGISVLADSNLPRNAKFVTIVGSTAASQASFWLTSVSAGREVHLRLVGDIVGGFTNNNTSLIVSLSGCILLNSLGVAITGIDMHTSAASNCGVHLIAPLDDVWAIVSEMGQNLAE